MRLHGSTPQRGEVLHPILALAAALAGVALMILVAVSGFDRLHLALTEIALVSPALVTVALLGLSVRVHLGLQPLGLRTALLSVLLGLAFWAGSNGLMELQFTLWPPSPGFLARFRELHALLRPHGAGEALMSLGIIALLPALAEELLCRGLLYASFAARVGAPAAVVLSAVPFALLHWDPRILFALVLGLGLGLLRARSGSAIAPALAHATLNAVTFALTPFLDDPTDLVPSGHPIEGGLWMLGGVAASVLLFRALPPAPGHVADIYRTLP
jgi:membrane protease YdiL (CAAX protease family)